MTNCRQVVGNNRSPSTQWVPTNSCTDIRADTTRFNLVHQGGRSYQWDGQGPNPACYWTNNDLGRPEGTGVQPLRHADCALRDAFGWYHSETIAYYADAKGEGCPVYTKDGQRSPVPPPVLRVRAQ